jgi:hypothetical protein
VGDGGGEEYDGCFSEFRIRLDPRGQFASVHPGHDYVQEDHVGPEFPGGIYCSGGAVDFAYFEAAGLRQVHANHAGEDYLVVDDEDFAFHQFGTGFTGALGIVHSGCRCECRVMRNRAPRGLRLSTSNRPL